MLHKLYFKTNNLDKYNNNIAYEIIYLFYLCKITS